MPSEVHHPARSGRASTRQRIRQSFSGSRGNHWSRLMIPTRAIRRLEDEHLPCQGSVRTGRRLVRIAQRQFARTLEIDSRFTNILAPGSGHACFMGIAADGPHSRMAISVSKRAIVARRVIWIQGENNSEGRFALPSLRWISLDSGSERGEWAIRVNQQPGYGA